MNRRSDKYQGMRAYYIRLLPKTDITSISILGAIRGTLKAVGMENEYIRWEKAYNKAKGN